MELTYKDVGKIIKRNWVFILVLTAAATVLGFGLSAYLLPKEYQATSLMIVSGSDQNREDQTAGMTVGEYDLNAKLVNSYSVISKSDRVLSQVKSRMNLNIDLDMLSKKVTVSSEQGTDIIKLAVNDASPQTAQEIANTLVDVFKTEVMNIMKMDNVQVIDRAALPLKPAQPSVTLFTAAGALIGLVAAMVVATWRYVYDDTVKDIAVISGILDAPVIGSVPRLV